MCLVKAGGGGAAGGAGQGGDFAGRGRKSSVGTSAVWGLILEMFVSSYLETEGGPGLVPPVRFRAMRKEGAGAAMHRGFINPSGPFGG